MSDNNTQPTNPPTVSEVVATETTELQMYKDYLQHISVDVIASRYGLTADGVYKIAKKNDWKKKRLKAKELAYKNLDKKYKEQIVDIVRFVQNDLTLLMQKCSTEKREMTMSERGYMLSLLEKFTKERRLNDGKPTDITDSNHVVRHEVILPKGVRRFGVIPPAANVIQVESQEIKLEETKGDIDIEDLQD